MAVRSLVLGAGGFPKQVVSEEERLAGVVPFAPLPSVADGVERVARALERAGVSSGRPVLDPDVDAAKTAFDDLREAAAGDPLVVHFSGHGVIVDDDLYLAVRGSEMSDLPDTALNTADLIRRIEHSKRSGHALFLLDVCGGGQALASQISRRLSGTGRKAWVIAACAADEATHGARFSHATAAVLDRLAKGWLDLSPALEYVPVDTLAAEIDRQLALATQTGGGAGQTVVRTPHEEAVLEPPPFFRNPGHAGDAASRFLARTDAALRQFAIDSDPGLDLLHFATRAAGGSRSDTCLFSGRTEQLQRITTWLHNAEGDQERLLVVTGGPGSGKSALLGVTACLTHPALAPIRQRIVARVRTFRPTPHAHILAVHARQLTAQQITTSLLRQLAAQLGTPAGDDPSDVLGSPTDHRPADVDRLIERLREAGPVVVLLDALDEAADPRKVLRELLLPLFGTSGRDLVHECRVVVGTRPWWDTLPDLQHITTRPGTLLDLDAQSKHDLTQDLEEYLTDLLYPHYGPATTHAIAHRLAHTAEHGAFLIAALYSDHLLGEKAAGRALTDQQITADLPCDITQMFDLHITALARANGWIRPVMAALGQARGQGMPLDLIHTAALALTPAAGDHTLPPSLQDTREALTQAAFYLRTSADSDGRLLYRYFHQALTDHTAPTADPTAIYHALLATIPPTPDASSNWELARPYLKRHSAAHAHAASPDAVNNLLTDPLYLLHADPDYLAAHLHHATAPQAVEHANIYRTTTAHHPHRHDPIARRNLLALDAAAWRNPRLARTLAAIPLDHQIAPATPQWATSHTAHPARLHTLTGHTDTVTAVAAATVNGRTTAVTTSDDRTVIVWDLATGQRARALTGHTGKVSAVAATTVDGRTIAVTAGDHEVIVWDLATGNQVHTLTGHTEKVTAVAATTVDGRTIAVTTSWDRTVIVWDLATGQRVRTLTGHTGWVLAVATATVDAHTVAVTAGDHEVIVWDLATGEQVRTLTGHTGWVGAVATATVDGRTVAVTTSVHGQVIVWNLATGNQVHTLGRSHYGTAVVATATIDGRTIAVTAGPDRQVIVWDLVSGEQVHTLTGRTEQVTAVATSTVDGRPVAVTTSYNQVIVWDLASSEQVRAHTGHSDHVNAAATATVDGRTVAVTGGNHEVIVWDLATGNQIRTLRDRSGWVLAVATATVDGRPVAITGGRRVIVWDLATGEQVRALGYSDLDHDSESVVHEIATATVDGRTMALTRTSRILTVWDLATGKQVHTLSDRGGWLNAVATATVDGRPVAVTTTMDRRLIVWDLTTGQRVHTLGHDRQLTTVATSTADGRPVAVTTGGHEVVVWDLANGQQVHAFPLTADTGSVTAVVATTVDARLIAIITGHDHKMITWDLAAGQSLYPPLSLPARGSAVATTHDRIILGYGSDIACLSWNTTTPQPTGATESEAD